MEKLPVRSGTYSFANWRWQVVGTAFALQILSNGYISLTMGVIIAGGSTLIFLALSALGKVTAHCASACRHGVVLSL
jgi:hypothetical protein